jgi:XTP/dITP diphosphohydrolase
MVASQIEINFASSNPNKVTEVVAILKAFNIKVNQVNFKVREIQANKLEDIAADSAKATAESTGKTIVVEDAGLFIDSLYGFPGPYSSFVYQTIGCKGILKLMEGVHERTAVFRSAVSYCQSQSEPRVFTGETKGKISLSERRGRKFGYDPIFIPDGVSYKTYSEMSVPEKNQASHRFRAFKKLAVWLITGKEEP